MRRIFFLTTLLVLVFTINRNLFAQFITDLKITEIMYNPPDELPVLGSSLEFIEIKNTGSAVLDLSNVAFVNGILFAFPFGTNINAGQHLVLVSDATAFANKYPGVSVAGQYTGLLANTGENIKVAFGSDTIIAFRYNDNLPWPVLADGHGYSIVPVIPNPTGLQEDGEEWRSSTNPGGSPGMDDPNPPIFPAVVVNELISNPANPDVDAVELHNATGSDVDVSGWFLSDDRNDLKKFKIPVSTIIPANGYLVYDASDIGSGPNGFLFSRSGDNVYLTAADALEDYTGYVHGWNFDGQFEGVSFGVYETSHNKTHFVAQSAISLGAVNAPPKVGPVVITKIMYNPLPGEEEFLEIKNISGSTVNLFSDDFTDSTWRISGMGFYFPPGISMAAGETILACDIDPADFRAIYDLPAAQQVFQFFGSLRNGGERIRLRARGQTDTTNTGVPYVPFVDIDVVEYDDEGPWPVDADGDGAYLLRTINQDYGNDPINWTAIFGDPFVGVESLFLENFVSIYPNPASDYVIIDVSDPSKSAIVEIYNLDNKRMETYNLSSDRIISLNGFSPGLYFLKTISDGRVFVNKLMIH